MVSWVVARQNFRILPIEVSSDAARLLELIDHFLSFLLFGLVWFVVSGFLWQRLVSRLSDF
jgi:hypothetical protein